MLDSSEPTRTQGELMTSTSAPHRPQVVRAILRTIAAATFAALTLAFLVEPTWLEGATGAEPDGGSGALELTLVLVAGAAALAASVGAGLAWRRVLTTGG
jgi:hypothetical protein